MRTGANSLTRSTGRIEHPLPEVEEKLFTMLFFPPQNAPDSLMTFRPFMEKTPKLRTY